MKMSDTTLKIKMDLQYDHSFGELLPYFQALGSGRAMARRCNDCRRVWFPPHATCPEDGSLCEWLELDGTGLVISVTETKSQLPFTDNYVDNIFLIVAMSGANNATFGKLIPIRPVAVPGDRVCLAKMQENDAHLVQTATFKLLKEDE